MLARRRPHRRATRRRIGRLLLRSLHRDVRDDAGVAGVERAGHAVGRGARPARHVRRRASRDEFRGAGRDAADCGRCPTDRASASATTPVGSTSGSATARWSTNRSSTPDRRGGWGNGRSPCRPTADRVAFTRNERGFGRLCVVDVATGEVTEVGARRARPAHVGRRSSRRACGGARTPTQIVVYDTSTPAWRRGSDACAVGPVVGWDSVELPEPEVVSVEHDGVTLARPPVRRRRRAHAVLDPRRTDRPVAGRVPAACRLLVVAGVGRARPRSARQHGPRPRLPAGAARRVGPARRRRHGGDRGGVAPQRVERARSAPW